MDILSANIFDLNALRKLEHECFDKDAWSLLDLIAVLSWGNVIRLKAVDSGSMIGFVAGETRHSNGEAWIATICVHPRWQRRGIGRLLLQSCEKQMNMPIVKLTVRPSNHGAITMYEQEGYRTVDIWKGYYNDGEDGLVMEKR